MLKIVSKNFIWEVRVNKEDSELFYKNGTPVDDVINLHNKIIQSNNEWDVAIYKDLVAFKNPCERTTYIYSKEYWNHRMRDSFKKLDTHVFE